jgi:broad specificity phosphatase PhoE
MRQFENTPYSMAGIKKEPVLYLVRHGATVDDDTYSGPTNPKLTEQGRKEGAQAAAFLSGRKTGDIVSSEMDRAKETASIIGKILGKKTSTRKDLDSLDVGAVSKISDKDEADRIIQHHKDNPHETIPGGESVNHFDQRVEPELMRGIESYYRTGKPPIFAVHHSIEHVAGKVFNNDMDSALTDPGGVIAIYPTESGNFEAIPIFKREFPHKK